MMDLLRDFRQGFRLLWRAPGFAVTAILTLALGIGATTALFTVVNAVLLEPLPFPESNKLIQLWRSELPALTYGSASDASATSTGGSTSACSPTSAPGRRVA